MGQNGYIKLDLIVQAPLVQMAFLSSCSYVIHVNQL